MSSETPPGIELTEMETKIFEAVNKSDTVLLKTLLSENRKVDIVDENSMTPLQHAAYKGNKEIVQLLLDQGANVNYSGHQHQYSALHFACLSGNQDVVLALLLAGANSQVTNTIGRTAAHMAAFVGNHKCVTIINNFVPKFDLKPFTETTDGRLKIPPHIVDSFHKFLMQVNIHPVKIVLNMHNFLKLNEYLPQITNVLRELSEKEIKRGNETNEVMSFKYHYLSYIIGEIVKIRQRQDDKNLDITELFTRKLLKPGKDGQLEFLEGFLKECIREFPHRECALFRQMIASLATKDPPSALSVVNSAINGQSGFIDNISICNTCGEENPTKKCSKCKVVQYCDRNCQRLHWHWHKKACSRLSQSVVNDSEAVAAPDAAELSEELQNLLKN